MPRNKIYAIVEGNGEADPPIDDRHGSPAVTILLARLLAHAGCWWLHADRKPFRMRSCGDFFAAGKLEAVLRAHKEFADCGAVLALFDLDDDCPAEVARGVAARVAAMEPLPFSVVIVCARREYEAWFLASLESIAPGRRYEGDPEGLRAAKEWLARELGYREVRDQARFTRLLDVEAASARSRSFRRLRHAVEEAVAAQAGGVVVVTPGGGGA